MTDPITSNNDYYKSLRSGTMSGQTPMHREWPDGVPCDHPGCLSHISHPCEGCGRIGGVKREATMSAPCTWEGCDKVGKVQKLDNAGKPWAVLCAVHAKTMDEIETSFLAGKDGPAKMMSAWIKAQGGSKKVTERMMR